MTSLFRRVCTRVAAPHAKSRTTFAVWRNRCCESEEMRHDEFREKNAAVGFEPTSAHTCCLSFSVLNDTALSPSAALLYNDAKVANTKKAQTLSENGLVILSGCTKAASGQLYRQSLD